MARRLSDQKGLLRGEAMSPKEAEMSNDKLISVSNNNFPASPFAAEVDSEEGHGSSSECYDVLAKDKENESDNSVIDTVVSALTFLYSLCSKPSAPAVKASWACKIQFSTICVVLTFFATCLLVYAWVGLRQDGDFGFSEIILFPWKDNVPKYYRTAIVKKSAIGVVTTHHRTGTVLFQNMIEKLSEQFSIDYERVEEPFKLQDPNATRTYLYQTYKNTTNRIVVGMHGYDEECPDGPEPAAYCKLFDVDCWLSACSMKTQPKSGPFLPVVHVVRNPVEILISAYLYHSQDPPPEEWLNSPKPDALTVLQEELQQMYKDTPYNKVLQDLDLLDGLLVEFMSVCAEIYRGARNYRDLSEHDWALNMHYEDFIAKYDESMVKVLNALGLTQRYSKDNLMEVVKKFDLNSMSDAYRNFYNVGAHLTEGKFNKMQIRANLSENLDFRNTMETLSQIMGYTEAFNLETNDK